jgi:hypothetical protein
LYSRATAAVCKPVKALIAKKSKLSLRIVSLRHIELGNWIVEAVKVDGAFGSIMFTSHTVLRCGTIGEKA